MLNFAASVICDAVHCDAWGRANTEKNWKLWGSGFFLTISDYRSTHHRTVPKNCRWWFWIHFWGIIFAQVRTSAHLHTDLAHPRTSAHPRGLAVAPAALAAPGSLPAARNCTLGFPWHRSPSITCKIGEEDFNPNLMQSWTYHAGVKICIAKVWWSPQFWYVYSEICAGASKSSCGTTKKMQIRY